MKHMYLVSLLLILVGCLPQSQVGSGKLASTNTPNPTDPTIPTADTSWNFLGEVSQSITINASNLNNSYIVGSLIENFLGTLTDGVYANFVSQDYCLVSEYVLGGVSYQFRSRIVPVSYYDFSAKRTVRILRVDFNDVINSTSVCNLPLFSLDPSGVYQFESSPIAVFNPSLLCPTCTSLLTASQVRIFHRNSTLLRLEELPAAQVDLTALTMAVDPNNNMTANTGTCSQSDCMSRGFDCCLDNQCVNDGSTRPSALTLYSSQLAVTEQERLQNPMAYLNYPHLYYICGSSVPTTTGGTAGGGSYDAAFEQLKKDYYCVELIKDQSVSTPFNLDVINPAITYTGNVDCKTTVADVGQTMYYQEVMKRLYQTCGCAKTTLSDMVTYCPAYDYTVATTDALGVPTSINCYTPPTVAPPVIPTQQSVSLNSRSAPHRFFDDTGVERDISVSGTTYTQEGDKFEYLDAGKILPVQQNFSINAVLGQMSVALDQALPAKAITVEYDQVYFLSTTSGYYSPCPTCAKDSWFASFTAFPSTSYGTGLQTVGHTTERDAFSTNTTLGNYEDTIFGRACWIPPTMIPFSHSAKTSTPLQRQNRLKTQAALFANGYQRDWYGFNKGALIGSFDGVSWFAIGKARIVRSTSKKLYLAINAPFADLATPNIHVVNVQVSDGITQATQLDYDPLYTLAHPYQNEAGNCQANHVCETDTDCITSLGWEYMCADIKDLKTQWPVFDADANELALTSTTVGIDQILKQKSFGSVSTKRCTYRGSGALCLGNSSSVVDLNKRKTLTCAPNFYCANVSSSGVFNSKISRYAAKLEDIPVLKNHYYGKDANVLGRPLSYISSADTTSLPTDVVSTLKENLLNYDALASLNTGLCLPGKALPELANQVAMSNPYTQHASSDATKRTDFISQIAGCNSSLYTAYRYSSCPVLGTDGNYEMFATATILTGYHTRASNQNACGLETLLNGISSASPVDTLSSNSPFRTIESKPLSQVTVVEPSLVRDACFRRAGQVCHTDLDCSPNKFHANQTDYFSTSFFGNDAEKKYYAESLVCGQMNPKPIPSDLAAFQSYDMSLNRCCRAVGSDLSTYTSDVPTSTAPSLYDAATVGLKLSNGTIPSDSKRYSRLATVENLGTAVAPNERPYISAYQERTAGALGVAGIIQNNTLGVNLLTPYQWKTVGEANSETCCGGGWIRKFADGTHDWTKRDRLYLDVTNFKCINSRTPLLTNQAEISTLDPTEYPSGLTQITSLVSQDYGDYCKDAFNARGSCAQYTISDSLTDTAPVADPIIGVEINTYNPKFSSTNTEYYFHPRSGDGDTAIIIDYNISGRKNFAIKMPSYVPLSSFDTPYAALADGATGPGGGFVVQIYDTTSEGTAMTCRKVDSVKNLPSYTTEDLPINTYCTSGYGCCYGFNSVTRVLKVIKEGGAGGVAPSYVGKQVALKITGLTSAGQGVASLVRTKPGTNSYYLKRLARLELSGIPQVAYKPLYCNDSSRVLVPGIFNKTYSTGATGFNQNTFAFKDAGGELYTNHHGLQTDQIFSENDFQCCTPLGKTTTTATKCCSNYGIPSISGTQYTCALPAGADLMVYFNRFVSNEGRATDAPGGGLTDADFETQTGEPLTATATINKISALGYAYCATGRVRQGGAFGAFEPEPQGTDSDLSNRIYNIVDSSNDVGQNATAGATIETGYNAFMDGFRWNNHLYCDD